MINKIKIEGYKSIKELNLKLESINVLIGANGVGKSNFISFFKLINLIYDQRLENYSMSNSADNLLYFGRKNTEYINCILEFNETNAYEFKLQPTIDNKLFIAEELTHFNKNKGDFKYYGSGWSTTPITTNSKESNLKNHNKGIGYWVNIYLNTLKIYHFHDTSEFSALRSSCNVNDNVYLKENGSNLAAFLYYLKERHNSNFLKIERIIQSVVPFFERFNLQPNRNDSNEILLEWTEKNHPENYFNASNFSDGTIRFIALTTLLLQPNLPKTIIIDEPELGLHPFAVNKLAGLIRKASAANQIIIATQSVDLVNNFEPNEIIAVDRENNQSVFNRLDNENLKDWLNDYSVGELWNKNIIGGRP
ncbi:AAA family ATPase [Flavobacterium sp.]|uniref:AAA family ATPase n=1 Tax=Flavobacterium sp. TaxID=239 RepID=UPI00286B115B|nr:AAA family ATPase [Flavobacterium sp.]